MASVGERLRQARESQGRELSQIAEQLRISSRYLAAIESGDLSRLPGGFFVRSFVRQYANALGVPEAELEPELSRLFSEKIAQPISPPHPPAKVPDLPPISDMRFAIRRNRRKPVGALAGLLAVVVVCSVLYALWFNRRTEEPPAPETATTARPRPVESPVRVPAAASPVEKPAVAEPVPAVKTPAATVSPPGSARGPLRFRITASEDTWVRVISGGRTLFSGILGPRESRSFSGLEKATLRIGNAGGLAITVNGQPLAPIGPRGQVRVITLTPQGSKVSVPAQPAPRNPLAAPGEPPATG